MLDFIEIKNIHSLNNTVKTFGRQAKDQEITFAKYIFHKGLLFKIYKNS